MKGCCVFNYNPLYRYPIYNEIGKQLGMDIYLGDNVFEPLEQFDVNKLTGFKRMLHAKRILNGRFVYHSGIWPLFSKGYDTYIVSADSTLIVVWLLLFYGKIFKKRVFLWGHGLKKKIQRPLTRVVYKLFYRSAAGVFLYNNYNVKNMLDIGCKKEKMFVIHNSLDYAKQLELRQTMIETDIFRNHFKNEKKNLIFIGRLTKVKKLNILLESLAILKQRGELFNLTFIGDGSEGELLKKMAVDLSIENQTWFLGACYDERKNAELIFNADLCVSPGNIGLTAMHSLMFGCPTLTNDDFETQMPEFEAIIAGKTGGFFKAYEPEDLANCIRDWFNTHSANREKVRSDCYKEIDSNWNPSFQMQVIHKALFIN